MFHLTVPKTVVLPTILISLESEKEHEKIKIVKRYTYAISVNAPLCKDFFVLKTPCFAT